MSITVMRTTRPCTASKASKHRRKTRATSDPAHSSRVKPPTLESRFHLPAHRTPLVERFGLVSGQPYTPRRHSGQQRSSGERAARRSSRTLSRQQRTEEEQRAELDEDLEGYF